MPRRCSLTGKKPLAGHNVSHAHNKTKRRQMPNLQVKNIFVPELNRTVRIKMTTDAIKTVTKIGLMPFLKKKGLRIQDVI